MPRASGRPTRKRDSPRSRAPSRSSRAAARTSSSVGIGCPPTAGSRSGSRAASCSSSRGRGTGSSARPTTRIPGGRRSSLRRRPTSTSCSRRSTSASTSTSAGATSSARTRACARSSATPAARRSRPPASTASPLTRVASSGSRAASTRPTGSWHATSSTPRSAGRRLGSADHGPRTCRWSVRAPRSELDQVAAASSGRSGMPRRSVARPASPGPPGSRAGSRTATGARRTRSRACPTSSILRCRSASGSTTSRARSRGQRATSSRSRSTTSSRGGCGSPRSSRTAARRSRPRVAAILGAELGWDEDRQADEVDRYLVTARREYGLPWLPRDR